MEKITIFYKKDYVSIDRIKLLTYNENIKRFYL